MKLKHKPATKLLNNNCLSFSISLQVIDNLSLSSSINGKSISFINYSLRMQGFQESYLRALSLENVTALSVQTIMEVPQPLSIGLSAY